MWTYDGILIEKRENKYKVFSNDEETFKVFATRFGELSNFFKGQILKNAKEDGLYQAEVGYGSVCSAQDPIIYWIRKISDTLDWSVKQQKENSFIEKVKNHFRER
ncbi:hypothetical protein A3K72_00725 [Candidatus Woesearchaeota archaeon RBG_13_36_6]|nr:MAG: hypothetical protein A3K72_00725 [Candidatus Woesearchaeota archaeon RBG_13_36_6]